MPRISQLVPKDWKIVSTQPQEEVDQRPNPKAQGIAADPKEPSTVNVGTGRYYVVVQDPEGHQRALYLTVDPRDNPTLQGKGGNPQVVKQTGVNDIVDPKTGLPPHTIYSGDLNNLNWQQSGAIGDVPAGTKTPSAVGDLEVVKDPTTDKPIALRDPKTGNTIELPKAGKNIATINGQTYVVDADGTFTIAKDAAGNPLPPTPKEKQQFNVTGIGLVEFDPASGKYTTVVGAKQEPKTTSPDQVSWTDIEGTNRQQANVVIDGKLQPIEGMTRDKSEAAPTSTYGANDPNSPDVVFLDSKGNAVGRFPKPGWEKPKTGAAAKAGEAITTDTEAPFIVRVGPNGEITQEANPNRQTVTQATVDFANSLGVHIANGTMTEKQAQALIDQAIQAMTAQQNRDTAAQSAATTTLSGINTSAQIGAGMLQNRVTAAQGALGNVLQTATSGPLVGVPAGLGAGLVKGIQDWTTELGGGPDVYQSAANLVQRADPTGRMGGDAASAYGALGQMLQKYRDLTGQPHPAEIAAAQAQSQPQQPFQSPATTQPQVQRSPLGGVVANSLGPATTFSSPLGRVPETAAASMARNGLAAPVTTPQPTVSINFNAGMPV